MGFSRNIVFRYCNNMFVLKFQTVTFSKRIKYNILIYIKCYTLRV